MGLSAFVKWPGGKTSELKEISKRIPKNMNRYFEPFVGGGAVLFSLSDHNYANYYVNDISSELIALYKLIKNENSKFKSYLKEIYHNWKALETIVEKHKEDLESMYFDFKEEHIGSQELCNIFEEFLYANSKEWLGIFKADFNPDIDKYRNELKKTLKRKFKRMKQLEEERGKLKNEDYISNIETIYKSAYYTHFRYIYNNRDELRVEHEYHISIFYFIREFCYSSMFRYNKLGGFNVPYGGMNYNRKDFQKKISYIESPELRDFMSKVEIHKLDFQDFFGQFKFTKEDFIFLDPPYDTDFSDYAENEFTKNDQLRLRNLLRETEARFMLVIKNTDFIADLYKEDYFKIYSFDKKYTVSFMNRNIKDVKHLLITNYDTDRLG